MPIAGHHGTPSDLVQLRGTVVGEHQHAKPGSNGDGNQEGTHLSKWELKVCFLSSPVFEKCWLRHLKKVYSSWNRRTDKKKDTIIYRSYSICMEVSKYLGFMRVMCRCSKVLEVGSSVAHHTHDRSHWGSELAPQRIRRQVGWHALRIDTGQATSGPEGPDLSFDQLQNMGTTWFCSVKSLVKQWWFTKNRQVTVKQWWDRKPS